MDKLKRKKLLKLALVVVLLVVAGLSIGVIVQDTRQEQASLRKQQELEQLWNSSTPPLPVELSSEAQPQYASDKFAELITLNPDLVGWLKVGELSTPVVQTDNNDYYLTHDFYGKDDPHGTVFVDSRNTVGEWNDNFILYGHNYSKSKQIFYEVERYKDVTYAASHPVFSFTSLYQHQQFVVLGLFYANTIEGQGDIFNYHNQLSFNTVSGMNDFITEIRSRSLITTNVEADASDSLITMSTCGYDFAGQRIVLVGRLLRTDEAPESLTSLTYSENPAPIMPEIWTRLYGKK